MIPSRNEPPPIVGNPFFHRGPVRDRRCFFGRVEETRRALEMLRNDQCVSIVGPRRIGKTSLLLHLCDPKVQKEHNLGTDLLFVYVDGQALRELNASQFYGWLWQEARRALAQRGETAGWLGRLSDFGGFRDSMRMVQERGCRLAFLFDEFESIALRSGLDQNVFSNLRTLVPILATYVTASQDGLDDLTCADKSALDSPFFNVFPEISLGFLTPKEVEEMILGLLQVAGQDGLFTREDFDFALEIAGHHPFFLQLACYHLFEYKMKGKGAAAVDYASVQQRYAEEAEKHFRYAWEKLDPNEQEAVQSVCKGKTNELGDGQKRQLERNCMLYNNAIFSSTFAEFVSNVHLRPKSVKEIVQTTGQIEQAALRSELVDHFSEEELRDLCFDLEIDYENLKGEGKAAKVRELVMYGERHDRLDQIRAKLDKRK